MRQCALPDRAEHSSAVSTVLIIDADFGAREMVDGVLRPADFLVTTASCAAEGLTIARSKSFDLILIDLCLPDMPGTDVIRALRRDCEDAALILMGGFLTVETAVRAIKLGAVDVIEKPVIADALLATVSSAADERRARRTAADAKRAVRHRTVPRAPESLFSADMRPRSAAERWATYVLKACESEGDLKTLADWATFAGLSYSSLCESCRLVDIRPHDARDLARVLRAVIRSSRHHCRPQMLLDVADRRTLERLLERADPACGRPARFQSAEQFLRSQRFVAGDNEGLRVLRNLVAERHPGHGLA